VNISGGAGADSLKGGSGDDIFRLSTTTLANSATAVDGGGGNDRLVLGVPGTIPIDGVDGIENYFLSGDGNNTLILKAHNFAGVTGKTITVNGGKSGNTIDASQPPAADTAILIGGAGADTLIAGATATMTGGPGADTFELTAAGASTVEITDFASGTDRIGFSNRAFGLGLSPLPRPLPAGLFVENAAGSFTGPAQRFAYSASSGDLFFDADGSGTASSAVKIAHLDSQPSLVVTDLFAF
jgi:Ca2+-binding RTX toxin-like protein